MGKSGVGSVKKQLGKSKKEPKQVDEAIDILEDDEFPVEA